MNTNSGEGDPDRGRRVMDERRIDVVVPGPVYWWLENAATEMGWSMRRTVREVLVFTMASTVDDLAIVLATEDARAEEGDSA